MLQESEIRRDRIIHGMSVLYSAERADSANVLNVSIALAGAALAYIGLTLSLSDGLIEWRESGATLWLPIPVMIMAAFHSLLHTLAAVRAISCLAIETKILEHCGSVLPQGSITLLAGERVMSFPRQDTARKMATMVTYGGILFVVVIYTLFCWIQGFVGVRDREWMWLLGGLTHVFLFVVVVGAWVSGIVLIRRIQSELNGVAEAI